MGRRKRSKWQNKKIKKTNIVTQINFFLYKLTNFSNCDQTLKQEQKKRKNINSDKTNNWNCDKT